MSPSSNPLADLRDIHLPADVSPWPLAIGWYFVMLIVGLALVGALYIALFKWKKLRIKQVALKQLDKWEARVKQNSAPETLLADISTLLKRVSLVFFPTTEVARLSGDEWLAFLDKTANINDFTKGEGRDFRDAPYRKKLPENTLALINIAKKWVKKIN